MTALLDGNVYPLTFRLHDNRFANSPLAVKSGGGFLRSPAAVFCVPTYYHLAK
jgi:hypothetical protein